MAGKWFEFYGRALALIGGSAFLFVLSFAQPVLAQDGDIDLTLELDDVGDDDSDDDAAEAAPKAEQEPLADDVDLLLNNASEPAAPNAGSPDATPAAEGEEPKAAETLESDFKDYLQYARMGKFQQADAFAVRLLGHAELAPELTAEGADQLVALTRKYNNSLETLNRLVNNSGIGDNAMKVMKLIEASYRLQRMRPSLILPNIDLLMGSPMERKVALDRLRESGEYAVPWMLERLADATRKELHPFIIRTLPLLGKRALNPLIEALRIENPNVRAEVATALGQIGYPQALPYLQRHAEDMNENSAVRSAAAEAVQRIVVTAPSALERPATDLFATLAEQYYNDAQTLRPDPREDRANVWFVREGVLLPVEVPRNIYRFVMAMRAAEESLKLEAGRTSVVALWMASNIKREAELGFDVESGEAVEGSLDPTRPKNFPRALYFARALGPRAGQLVLRRAIATMDRELALGVIAGLRENAGGVALVEPAEEQGSSLAAALAFPDLLVRIRAALALGQALPPRTFRGAEDVVPVLSSALNLKGNRHYLVVEPNSGSRRVIADILSNDGAIVIAADRLTQPLDQAHRELSQLDGVFLSSDMNTPSVIEAVHMLAKDVRFSLTPIVVLIKVNDALKADQIRAIDGRIGLVLDATEADVLDGGVAKQMIEANRETAVRYRYRATSSELELELALDAARTLRLIGESAATPFDIQFAQRDLIQALAHPSEELRITSASALAVIATPAAQQAIGTPALDPSQTESLRVATFGSLAESARRFGPMLRDDQVATLTDQGMNEPNLTLRTAASQALGAMNFPAERGAEIILSQPQR